MSIQIVQSSLLSVEDRARVAEALRLLEESGALPEAVREPVLRLLRLVADGRTATVLENEADLTTTQAAEVLGVSRPFLTHLLEEGRIPFHLTGRDRRIAAEDVIQFKKERDELKKRRAEAARTYVTRRNERIASSAGVSVEEAEKLGFG